MTKHQIIALANGSLKELKISTLTSLGGTGSSGIVIKDLSRSDDYVILSDSGGELMAHPLRGKKKNALSIKPGEVLQIEDLSLIYPPNQNAEKGDTQALADDRFFEHFESVISSFAQSRKWQESFKSVLSFFHDECGLENGVFITKTINNQFEVQYAEGGLEKEAWLTESLIQSVISSKKPEFVHNVIGSRFMGSHSIMATGFLSIFCWPLLLQNEVLGVLVVGSKKPHSGLSEAEKKKAQLLSQLAALALNMHLENKKLEAINHSLKRNLNSSDWPLETECPALIKTLSIGKQIASSELSVLIHGETGVGKEKLSSWIHNESRRKQKPFVVVNCGAIPHELLESLLFGHKKGSFTGAQNDHKGKFQQADGGTLFLDEIGDLPEQLQVKLLRVLQEKTIDPVGHEKAIPVDVRIVAASHKNLSELVEKGKFREDLYYRLAEMILVIPPLRERPQDIELIAGNFLKKEYPDIKISASAWDWLRSQQWRGNVRELLASLKRAAILAQGGEICVEHLLIGSPLKHSHSIQELGWLGGENLEDAKNRFIESKVSLALERAGGNRNEAAKLLGISARTLFRHLESITSS